MCVIMLLGLSGFQSVGHGVVQYGNERSGRHGKHSSAVGHIEDALGSVGAAQRLGQSDGTARESPRVGGATAARSLCRLCAVFVENSARFARTGAAFRRYVRLNLL